MQDLRYALRTMRRNAGFTTVAVVTLAFGIGANTVVFSLVHTVLLRPLPYQDPDRLVAVWNRWNGIASAPLSDPEYLDYSERSRTMTLAASAAREVNVGGTTGDPERVFAAFVTANTFDVLGVTPALGRGFRAGEDTAGPRRRDHLGLAVAQAIRGKPARHPGRPGAARRRRTGRSDRRDACRTSSCLRRLARTNGWI